MEEPERPRLSSLVHLACLVNVKLQQGNHGITFGDVYRGLEAGDLFRVLEAKMPGFDHFGAMTESEGFQPELLIEALSEAAEVFRGEEHKKLGISDEGAGLSLLMALVLELISGKRWTDAPPVPRGFRKN